MMEDPYTSQSTEESTVVEIESAERKTMSNFLDTYLSNALTNHNVMGVSQNHEIVDIDHQNKTAEVDSRIHSENRITQVVWQDHNEVVETPTPSTSKETDEACNIQDRNISLDAIQTIRVGDATADVVNDVNLSAVGTAIHETKEATATTHDNVFSLEQLGKNEWLFRNGDQKVNLSKKSDTCPVCFRIFTHGSNLRKHIKTEHIRIDRFECCECSKSYASKFSLSYHRAKVHKSIKDEEVLKKLTKVHRSIKDGKVLEKPIKRGDKKKACDVCNKLMGTSILWRHMQEVHKYTNIDPKKVFVPLRPFKCDQCSFSTKRKHDLQRHIMKQHAEVEPSYECKICQKLFSYESSMKRHLKSSHS